MKDNIKISGYITINNAPQHKELALREIDKLPDYKKGENNYLCKDIFHLSIVSGYQIYCISFSLISNDINFEKWLSEYKAFLYKIESLGSSFYIKSNSMNVFYVFSDYDPLNLAYINSKITEEIIKNTLF